MQRWSTRRFPLLLLLLAVSSVTAFHQQLRSRSGEITLCEGMYAKGDVAGSGDSTIRVVFPGKPASDADISVVIYNWEDEGLLGIRPANATTPKEYICGESAIQFKMCTEKERGKFLYSAPEEHQAHIYTEWINARTNKTEPHEMRYNVSKTGWYCINSVSVSDFEADVYWESPFGKAPASEYPKLLFYGIFSLIYLVMFVAWMTRSYFSWSDILPVQNYIVGLMFYLTVEMAVHYGFWEDYNSRGEPSLALMVFLAILNAGRNSLSFFLLLIVSLGYGVMRPTLGSAMFRCKLLAYVHFVCGALYAAGTMLTTPETAGLLVLIFVLPLSITMTTFYFWILNGLTNTTQLLETRKQHVKLTMYRRLWRILVLSVLLLGLFFIVNTISVAHQSDSAWIARRWHYRWFLLDGWLNVEYFFVFSLIAFFWRPTKQNQRYGLQELPSSEQDADDAFAIDDDEEDDGAGFRVVGAGDRVKLGQVNPPIAASRNNAREVGLGGARPVTGEPIFDIADEDDEDDDEDGHHPRGTTQRRSRAATATEAVEEMEAEHRPDGAITVRIDDP